jgi:hypothetical protein
LFTVHCSLFTVHCSLFTVHCSRIKSNDRVTDMRLVESSILESEFEKRIDYTAHL